MKSCLGILLVFFTLVVVLGGGALIWYLSDTAEFSRKAPVAPSAGMPAPPKATVAIPKSVPKARPVR